MRPNPVFPALLPALSAPLVTPGGPRGGLGRSSGSQPSGRWGRWGRPTALLALLAAVGCGEPAPDGHGLVPDDGTQSSAQRPSELDDSSHEGHGHGGASVAPNERAYFHDFGGVPDGSVAKHVFQLENTDPIPLTIVKLAPSCGCTVPSVRTTDLEGNVVVGMASAEPEILVVQPGGMVELEVQIETDRIRLKNARKLLSVRVVTDSPNDPFLTLECSILVQQSFRVEQGKANIGRVAVGAGGRGFARVIQDGATGDRIVAIGQLPENVSASIEEVSATGNAVWRIDVEALPPLPLGPYQTKIELLTRKTDGSPSTPFHVEIAGLVRPDLEVRPAKVILREFQGDGADPQTTQVLSNVPGARFAITGASIEGSEGERIVVTYEPIEPDPRGKSERWEVRVAAMPGIEAERFSGTIWLQTDDPQNPELTLTYAGL